MMIGKTVEVFLLFDRLEDIIEQCIYILNDSRGEKNIGRSVLAGFVELVFMLI